MINIAHEFSFKNECAIIADFRERTPTSMSCFNEHFDDLTNNENTFIFSVDSLQGGLMLLLLNVEYKPVRSNIVVFLDSRRSRLCTGIPHNKPPLL